jgi:hypothetical protein
VNTEQLKKNVNQRLRLRPQPRVVRSTTLTVSALTSDGPRYAKNTVNTDYEWLLVRVTADGVTLRCDYTSHELTLGPDNVREFRTPNFLLLKGQVILEQDGVRFEPS